MSLAKQPGAGVGAASAAPSRKRKLLYAKMYPPQMQPSKPVRQSRRSSSPARFDLTSDNEVHDGDDDDEPSAKKQQQQQQQQQQPHDRTQEVIKLNNGRSNTAFITHLRCSMDCQSAAEQGESRDFCAFNYYEGEITRTRPFLTGLNCNQECARQLVQAARKHTDYDIEFRGIPLLPSGEEPASSGFLNLDSVLLLMHCQ